MAEHWSDQLADAVLAKLTVPALSTVSAANVFAEDEYPRESGKFPGINIVVANSQTRRIGTVNAGNGVQLIQVEHLAVVTIQAMVRQDTGCRKLLTRIFRDVEARWLATPADKGLGMQGCRDSEQVAIDQAVIDNDSDILTASQTQQYQVTVRSFEGRPDQS